jgi:putative Ca2+/H+ antiporter (TMEM165/GDT1 family)
MKFNLVLVIVAILSATIATAATSVAVGQFAAGVFFIDIIILLTSMRGD